MNKIDKIQLRRQLLDWRDKHVENIHHHLNREIKVLFHELDRKVDKMSMSDIRKNDIFFKKYLTSVFNWWVKKEVALLMNAAQADLDNIYEHTLEYETDENGFKHKNYSDNTQDAKVALLSGSVAVAAIPSVVSLSTVSAGGVLGLVGVTVISWPIALTGGALVLGLGAFGGKKMTSRKLNAINRYKKNVHESVRKRVVNNKKGESVCQCLQAQIEEVTNNLITEINI